MRVGAQPIEHGRPRKRRIHHDETRDLVPERLCIGIGHHQADIVPDQDNWAGNAQRVAEQMPDVARHRQLVVTCGRTRGMPRAAISGATIQLPPCRIMRAVSTKLCSL
jgi:hypothetical protein